MFDRTRKDVLADWPDDISNQKHLAENQQLGAFGYVGVRINDADEITYVPLGEFIDNGITVNEDADDPDDRGDLVVMTASVDDVLLQIEIDQDLEVRVTAPDGDDVELEETDVIDIQHQDEY